jgi:NitT/TauT family transport system substrate-binding protein
VRFAQARTFIEGCLPGRVRRKHAVALAIATVTLAPLAAGCGGSGSGNRPTGTTTIRVAAVDGVDTAPLFIAIKDGAFARAGLNIDIKPYSSVGEELDALSSGDVDIAAGDYVDFFKKVSRESKPYLSIIADGYDASSGVMEVLSLPTSGISTPQDLLHKTIGTTLGQGYPASDKLPYNLDTLATDSVLESDGYTPGQLGEIHWQAYSTGTDLIDALKDGKVSAILVEEPYIYDAESQLGAVPIIDSCSGATADLPLSGYFSTMAFQHNSPSAVRTFVRVLHAAQKSAALPGPVRIQLNSEPGMSMQAASLVTLGTYPSTLNAASVQRVANLMFDFDLLHPAISVSSLIDKSLTK